MSSQVYSVPVLYQEVRPAESYLQLHDALKSLENVVAQVFTRITSRVTLERTRLESLEKRIVAADARINLVATSNRAATIQSPARYPAAEQLEDVLPVYVLPPQPTVHHSPLPRGVTAIPPVVDLLAGVQLMESVKARRAPGLKEGLGRLPATIPSVSNLLLFNTTENPYRSYVTIDNLEGKEGHNRHVARNRALVDAPPTVSTGDVSQRYVQEEYGYVPKLGNVPRLDVPSNLPELSGVAPDIGWKMDLPTIAPSHILANLPQLPTVGELPTLSADVPPSQASSVAPPPQPTTSGATTSAPSAPAPKRGGPPPPPPPEDFEEAPKPAVKKGGPPPPMPLDDDVPGIPPGGDSDRGALLADLVTENPMARLKKAKSTPAMGDKPAPKKSKAPPPMDMMSALTGALNMRRKAMTQAAEPASSKVDDMDDMDSPIAMPKAAPKPTSAPAPKAEVKAPAPPPTQAPAQRRGPAAPPPPSMDDEDESPIPKPENILKSMPALQRAMTAAPKVEDDDEWD